MAEQKYLEIVTSYPEVCDSCNREIADRTSPPTFLVLPTIDFHFGVETRISLLVITCNLTNVVTTTLCGCGRR